MLFGKNRRCYNLDDCWIYKVTYYSGGKESDSYVVPYLFRHPHNIFHIGYNTCIKILKLKEEQVLDHEHPEDGVVDMYRIQDSGLAVKVVRVQAIKIKKVIGISDKELIDTAWSSIGLSKKENANEERGQEQA